MKSIISSILLVVCLCVLCFVAGAQPPRAPNQVPPDIAVDSWLPITSTLGFVITGGGAPGMPRSGSVSTVTGYFMALKDDAWVRLEIAPPSARPVDPR
jgi:hypothetical protein